MLWKLLTGGTYLRSLFQGDRFDGGVVSFSAGRAQLLTVSVLFAVHYFIQILRSSSGFPPIPDALLYVLGGSQATYLAGKTYDLVLRQVWDDLQKGRKS